MKKHSLFSIKKALLAIFLCASQMPTTLPAYSEFHDRYEDQYLNEFDCCAAPSKQFVISGELLYLKPTIEQSSYVISSTDNVVNGDFFPSGHRHRIKSTYKPGFRIEGLYELCPETSALDVRFAYLKSGFHDSVTGPFLFDTIGFPGDGAQSPEDAAYAGTASIKDHYRYYAVDLTFNRLSLESCVDNLTLLMGLHYANIKQERNFTSTGTFLTDGVLPTAVLNHLKSDSHFWGIGPQLGLDYNYNLTQPTCSLGVFSINANARGALLASKTDASFHFDSLRTAGTAGVNLDNDSVWRVSPCFDARIGATYQFSCFCLDATVELGYEWLWYNDSIDSITGYDVALPGDSLDVYNNLSLQGPFLRLGVAF